MTFDVKVLSLVNFILQAVLIAAVFVAAYLVKKKRAFQVHCAIMRVAVFLQILAIAIVMLPSMLGYLVKEEKGVLFNAEMLAHHTLGLAVVLIWVYINLADAGRVRLLGRLVIYMRLTISLWVLAFLVGLHLYLSI